MNRAAFFDRVRECPFRGALTPSQVEGTGVILDAWEKYAAGADLRWIAYALATTYHETSRTMQPIEEIGKGRAKAYGHPTGPWAHVYDGRGDVQLTWLANYAFATRRLHQLAILPPETDLVKNPELAMKPEIAAPIMIFGMIEGWFTHHKLADYFDARHSDARGARRIINGQDCAALIAGYHAEFLAALDAAKA